MIKTFKRKLSVIGNSFWISVPMSYVKEFKLNKREEYNFALIIKDEKEKPKGVFK